MAALAEEAIFSLPKVSGMQADKLYLSRELDNVFNVLLQVLDGSGLVITQK